jgi:hypothetical protein
LKIRRKVIIRLIILGTNDLKLELKVDESKFLKEEHKVNGFKSQMDLQKEKIK